jgi:periplasmic protein CpxP/Spy
MKREGTTIINQIVPFVRPILGLSIAVMIGSCSGEPMVSAQMPPGLSNASLSAAQQKQVQKIQAETKEQLATVLTSDQLSQFESVIQQGEKPRQALASLNLSSEKKSKIREILQAQRQKMMKILTPEQKQQLQKSRSTASSSKKMT